MRTDVKDLQARAKQACVRIAHLFETNTIDIGTGKSWGQFLDDDRSSEQHGLFGTSAGIQVLCLHGQEDGVIVREALATLPDLPSRAGEHYYDKGDLFNTYKLSAFAAAVKPGEAVIGEQDEVMEQLRLRQLPGAGWGHYWIDEATRDSAPNVTATCTALLSLIRYQQFVHEGEWRRALEWLRQRLDQNGGLQPYDCALVGLTLAAYLTIDKSLDNRAAVQRAKRLLQGASRKSGESRLGTADWLHYGTRQTGVDENRYLFYPTGCLIALALLRLGNPRGSRGYVLRAVRLFAGSVREHGSFRCESDGRVHAVDQWWIYQLLQAFSQARYGSVVRRPFVDVSGVPFWGRIALLVALIMVVVAGVIATKLFTQEPGISYPVYIVVIVAGLLAAIVAVDVGRGTFGRGGDQ